VRFAIPAIVLLAVGLGAGQARAASCSAFLTIKSYDAAKKTVEVDYERGSESKFFPRPEGSTTDTTKIPKSCTKKVTRNSTLEITPTGGRMTVTQVRSNFEGKMLNDTDDAEWVANHIKKLIADKTTVVAVLRPGRKRKDPVELTTLYLPVTDEELAEIARIDAQAEEVE
jgi:hypothetical protein